MDFDKYSKLVTWFFENDNREGNYQNRILIPFFEDLFENFDVVDTSTLTKEWDRRGIDRKAFAGIYTPDLLIALNWSLIKSEKNTVEYKALVEVKTPTAADREHAESEIKEYLDKVPFVILTNCVTWEFYKKENGNIYSSVYSLEKEHNVTHLRKNKRFGKNLKIQSQTDEFPAKVCKRYKTEIVWNDTDWEAIKQVVQNLEIKKENIVSL